jgi:hypothetical protein
MAQQADVLRLGQVFGEPPREAGTVKVGDK